jgi:Saxitoxin biosynthesis operon protein SxtJ
VSTHERIDRHEEVVGSSDRSFGFVFAGVFTIITLVKLWRGWTDWGYLWLGLAIAFAVAATAAPSILAPLNRVWLKIGLALHKVMTPLIMGLLFFLVVTPIGLIMRATGKDILRLKRSPEEKSYWIDRTPPGPAPDTMKNQF